METVKSSADQVTARVILSKLCQRRLSADEITADMSLFDDLGIESLQFIRLVLELEEELGRKVFDIETLAGIKTVGDVYQAISLGQD